MSITSQLSALKALIDAAASSLNINATFNYEPTDTPKTPAVSIVPISSSEEDANNNQNLVTRDYRVRVIVERSTQVTDSAQEALLWTIVDGLSAVFRDKDNQYLSCNALKVTPIGLEGGGVAQKGNEVVRYADITVQTEQLETI